MTAAAGLEPSAPTPQAVNPGTVNFLAKYVTGADVGNSAVFENTAWSASAPPRPLDVLHVRYTNTNGGLTGYAVQNLGNTADLLLRHALLRPERRPRPVPGLQQRHPRIPHQQHRAERRAQLRRLDQLHDRHRRRASSSRPSTSASARRRPLGVLDVSNALLPTVAAADLNVTRYGTNNFGRLSRAGRRAAPSGAPTAVQNGDALAIWAARATAPRASAP